MKEINNLIQTALFLAIFTIFYNVIEGVISIYFGYHDETLALFGFGIDSFVEVFSGLGVFNMLLLTKKNNYENNYEKTALKITAISFYVLAFGLIVTAIMNLYYSHNPITTKWGIIISLISLLIMWWLIDKKNKIGYDLKSDAIIADANCNKVCLQLSIILLLSSLLFYYFNIGYVDSIGALFIAYLSFKEGVESFKKSKNKNVCC